MPPRSAWRRSTAGRTIGCAGSAPPRACARRWSTCRRWCSRAAAAAAVEGALSARGVETRRWWGLGGHTSPAFADCPRGDLAETDRLGGAVLGLPFAIDLGHHQIGRIAEALAE